MLLWRLQRSVYSVLDGEGARRYGGRWNSPGRAVVYASESLALCALELLVHLDTDLLPEDLTAFELEASEDIGSESISESQLPASWRESVSCNTCRTLGDAWLETARSAILAVPAAVVFHGTNYLINTLHPDAKRIRVVRKEPFRLDPRLLD